MDAISDFVDLDGEGVVVGRFRESSFTIDTLAYFLNGCVVAEALIAHRKGDRMKVNIYCLSN